jgi:hypothetical protein
MGAKVYIHFAHQGAQIPAEVAKVDSHSPFTAALLPVAASEENRNETDCGGYERTFALW